MSQKCLPVCKPYRNLKLLDNAVFFPHDCLPWIFKRQFYSQRRGSLSRLTVVLKSSCDFFFLSPHNFRGCQCKVQLKCCQVFNLT